MGLQIRYLAPAAAGSAFAYSVERRADGSFFDFELDVFRSLDDISIHATTGPLIYDDDGAMTADFDHVEDGEIYVIRIHHAGLGSKIIAELPLIAQCEEGEPYMQPSFRSGKKFFNGEVIEARHRFTFYGDDGFTIHTATLWEDDTSSCNCPRWIKQVKGEERRCPHSQRALTLTANIDETGERPDPVSAVPKGASSFRRPSRPVDT